MAATGLVLPLQREFLAAGATATRKERWGAQNKGPLGFSIENRTLSGLNMLRDLVRT